jgi:hypothetical protein
VTLHGRAASRGGRVAGGDCGWVATSGSWAVAGRSLAPAAGSWVAAHIWVATAGSGATAVGRSVAVHRWAAG